MIKLIIEDSGEPTVGIFPSSYTIDTPFLDSSFHEEYEEMKNFKERIEMVFNDFINGEAFFYWKLVTKTALGECFSNIDYKTNKPIL